MSELNLLTADGRPMPLVTREPTAIVEVGNADLAAATMHLAKVIERAAFDSNISAEKMERLYALQERSIERFAKTSYQTALAAMQAELPVIGERGGITNKSNEVQSTYALWEDIVEQITPILRKHGFGISFRTGREDGQIVVTGVLSHRDGHSEQTTMHLPLDTTGSKNAVQAVGSSTSYGMRYTAKALLNFASRGEDDDGIAGGAKQIGVISDAQRDALNILADQVGADKRRFCTHFKINSIAELPAAKYDMAIGMLQQKRKPAAMQRGVGK